MKFIKRLAGFLVWVQLIFPLPTLSQSCNDWLRVPTLGAQVNIGDLDISGSQLTVEAQFNRTEPLNSGLYYGSLVSKHTDQTNVNYSLLPNGCEITTSISGYKAIFQSCPVMLNRTYHVAMVYNGSMLRFYRDGYLLSETPCSGNIVNNNLIATIGQLAGGNNFTDNQFLGYINEVRIWNTARSQAQLTAYMAGALPSPASQPGLIAYYSFNNLVNKQGNSNWNGVLSGSAAINQVNPNCQITPDSCGIEVETILNDYAEVLAFDVCKNLITVDNASEFNTGDTVLLIQMKGAGIDLTNSSSFGNLADYNGSGNYEFNYVKSVTGNVIELLNVVERQYQVPDGKVQLVRVPYFQNYTATARLTCMPWNGSKGGVLVFNVENALVLEKDITVTGKGFRGGEGDNTQMLVTNCFTNGFVYPSSSTVAAEKGESIALLNSSQSRGKGAPAGGGGGGLDHNSGGGGGGNGGGGGYGGYQLEPCGNSPFDNRGLGGRNLSYSNAQNKIFLGSGGGAGHANNPANASQPSSGGNGGGIVIISAQSIQSNNNARIMANGNTAPGCTGADCHDAMGGGGAGGTVLLDIPQVLNSLPVEVKGGKGADMSGPVSTAGRIGSGGGGGGGVCWTSAAVLPANIVVINSGGPNGVLLTDNNNAWGATPGQQGITLTGLQLPIDDILFEPNIDSVWVQVQSTGCNNFDFSGLAITNTNPVASWHWDFGDGAIANTQNATHVYTVEGTFTVKLMITDINGCIDSFMTDVNTSNLGFDFTYVTDVCNPLAITFHGAGSATLDPQWDFGDGSASGGNLSPAHVFPAPGNYNIQFSLSNGICRDTITKTISIGASHQDIIITPDTTICYGTGKWIRTLPSLNFCWTPTTYLDDPGSPNPVSNTPEPITYYFTAELMGTNLVANGNFSQGNTGFNSAYQYSSSSGANPSVYHVGSSVSTWNAGMAACSDHTGASGNMLMVNGGGQAGVEVWSQTITVQPHTNYAFSAWMQSLSNGSQAQLQFSINGIPVGQVIAANSATCIWDRFFVLWNAGNRTSADIAIVYQSQDATGNDFALDDISFSPVITRWDSVRLMVDTAMIRTNGDTIICNGTSVQLLGTGAQSYSWTPSTGLSSPSIDNPIATPVSNTAYIVTGTTAFGCTAMDTVNISVHPVPVITVTGDTTICSNASLQLSASGGLGYTWTPAATLSDPTGANPIASPPAGTTYYVTVTDGNACTYLDSVRVDVQPLPVFSVNAPVEMCLGDSVQLTASGGDLYQWSPAAALNDASISSPLAFPAGNATFTVMITESVCNVSQTLTTEVTVLPLPGISASSSNDIDCSNDRSQLTASGGVQYSWSPASSLDNASIPNPLAMPTVTTLYTVTGTDAKGCTNYDTVTVAFKNENKGNYLMPTGFTPNGDGLNDCYGIKFWGVVHEIEFSIFNRWGERVFYTTDPSRCWSGTYKGVMQDPGVYVYMVRAKTICDNEVFRKGTFVLIR